MSYAVSITQDGTVLQTAGKYIDQNIVVGISDTYYRGPFAFVLVTYPEGATLTCTNAIGRKDISDTQRLYYIKKGNVPFNCVVTATDGIQTASKIVSIKYEGQSINFKLSYELVLFDGDNGGDNTEVTGGWNRAVDGTFTNTETQMIIVSGTSGRKCVFAANPIPIYDYSRIIFTGYVKEGTSSLLSKQQFFIATEKTNKTDIVVAAVTPPIGAPGGEVYIDLTALSLTEGVNYYVGFSNASLGSGTYLLKCILE